VKTPLAAAPLLAPFQPISTNVFAEMESGLPAHVRNELALPEQLSAVLENVPVGDEAVRTTIFPEDTATVE
jgi:hypothetical protein